MLAKPLKIPHKLPKVEVQKLKILAFHFLSPSLVLSSYCLFVFKSQGSQLVPSKETWAPPEGTTFQVSRGLKKITINTSNAAMKECNVLSSVILNVHAQLCLSPCIWLYLLSVIYVTWLIWTCRVFNMYRGSWTAFMCCFLLIPEAAMT